MTARGVVVAAMMLPASGVAAQEVVELGPVLASHAEEFALLNGVRELSDGRVVVADPLGMILAILSPDLARATPLGRQGQGPEEYGQPDAVWPLPGDSTLLVDLGNTRLTVLDPDGAFVRTRPLLLAPFDPGRGGLSMMMPRGVDARGRIYFEGSRVGPDGSVPDSVSVLRFDPGSGAVDTLARVRLPETRTETSGGVDDRRVSTSPVPLSAADGWAVAPDGRLGVVRESDYHVEWMGGGEVLRGPPTPYEPVAIGRAEREAWADEQQRNGGLGVSVSVVNGEASVSMARQGGRRPGDLAGLPWPDHMAPFVASSVRVDLEGRLWVQRSQEAGAAPLYDVFDGAGRHMGSVRFPQARRLVGFGAGRLYAVAVGDFDLLTLERYAQPSW